MPQGLDGAWNIAGLQVPGVYVDIIPPSPNLVGVPTNKVGLVGVGSWGPLNAVIPCSAPADASVKIGNPTARPHDIASYIEAGNQVGGTAAYQCLRVSDGTDTAATASIQSAAITLTAKYTGILGNSCTYLAQAGTLQNSYAFTLGFPGSAAEFFNNIALGIGSVVTVPGTTYTSVPTAALTAPPVVPGAVQAVLNPTLSIYSNTLVTGGTSGFVVNDFLNFANGVVLKVATVSAGVVLTVTVQNAGLITGGATPTGTQTMISTSGAGLGSVTWTFLWGLGTPTIVNPGAGYVTAPTVGLTGGGTGTGGSYTITLSPWLNLANAINNGNATRAYSQHVVATAGTSGATPILGVTTTFTGGTDGAGGVADSNLLGQDTLPRKGAYALRNSGCSAVACCDLTTYTMWPALDALGLSEGWISCVSDISGNSIAQAVAARTSVGLDDEWTWLAVGDFPSFYDAFNGVTRQISPQAYQIAYIGNSSPEQSPLNKVLRGITSTQKTLTQIPYADADLLAANIGGVDLIIGPPSTVGGSYYTWGTGRNASSNTAANGVEYTTLTDFLANTANSKAAGSIIGQLQSIQPTDPTRAKAKALFDGFSAFLASPQSGSGGYGLIDTWAVQCDLNNNPQNLQSLGYLFLYWQVRYLNVVRYFVVKLAGGGNVIVTIQSTPPSPAQFQ